MKTLAPHWEQLLRARRSSIWLTVSLALGWDLGAHGGDGISGPSIEACVRAAGGTVVFGATECFV